MSEEIKTILKIERSNAFFAIGESKGLATKVEGDKRYYFTTNNNWFMPKDEEIGILLRVLIENNVMPWKKREHIESFKKIIKEIEDGIED